MTAIIQHGPDHIITSSVDGMMKIWNIAIFRESPFQKSYEHESLRVSDTIVDKTSARTMVKISAQELAAGCSNGSIQIWDLKNKKCIRILKGHTAAVLALIQLHAADGKKYKFSATSSQDKHSLAG